MVGTHHLSTGLISEVSPFVVAKEATRPAAFKHVASGDAATPASADWHPDEILSDLKANPDQPPFSWTA